MADSTVEKTEKPATKSAAKAPATKKIKMLTGQAGFNQVPVTGPDGKQLFDPRTGKPQTQNGSEFVRNPNMEYEVDATEAEILIENGYAAAA